MAPGEYKVKAEAFVFQDTSPFDNDLTLKQPVILVAPGGQFPGGAADGRKRDGDRYEIQVGARRAGGRGCPGRARDPGQRFFLRRRFFRFLRKSPCYNVPGWDIDVLCGHKRCVR